MQVLKSENQKEDKSFIDHKTTFWQDPAKRSLFYQALVLVLLGGLFLFFYSNTKANLEKQNIASGFEFLNKEASFEIGETLISYSSVDTYGRALWAGLLNTLKVAVVGNILAIILGTFIGVARLSSNLPLSFLAKTYIEVIRNIPLLLQLFFWYGLITERFPPVRSAFSLGKGIFLCNRGLIFGVPKDHPWHLWVLLSFLGALGLVFLLKKWAQKRQERTGERFPLLRSSLGLLGGVPFLVWLLGGAPRAMDLPLLEGFNFVGGMTISPEFLALTLGLVLYTAGFIAEIVRAGIQSVGKGQKEAAASIGLRPTFILTLVILPQALRVAIPPLTSQMLNLTKNSSLAVAIGFPDFVSVANTTMNQTGQAIEAVLLIMMVYLSLSLLTSWLMNWYNKKTAFVTRSS